MLAGAGKILVVDEKNLAVYLTDDGDAGVVVGRKGQMFPENAFGRQIFEDAPGSVVFVADDGSLAVQQDAHDLPGRVEGIDFFSGIKAAFFGLHAGKHFLAVFFADILK